MEEITVQPMGSDYTVRASERVWDIICGRLVDDGNKIDRDLIAHKLSDEFLPTPTPASAGEVIAVLVTEQQLDQILKICAWEGDRFGGKIGIDHIEAAYIPEPTSRKANRMPRRSNRQGKQQRQCECGCGGMTFGMWVPGHDSVRKSALIKKVDTEADSDAAAELVSRGWWKIEKAEARLQAAAGEEIDAS